MINLGDAERQTKTEMDCQYLHLILLYLNLGSGHTAEAEQSNFKI